MSLLCLRNSHRARKVDLGLFRKIVLFALRKVFKEPHFELGIRLVGADEMAKINETFLHHAGSTDVVTFDYKDEESIPAAEKETRTSALPLLHGEIFISLDDAVTQARQFRTTWQTELARYAVHGILHLRGFDDLNTASRKKMKREESRVLRILTQNFPLSQLQRKRANGHG